MIAIPAERQITHIDNKQQCYLNVLKEARRIVRLTVGEDVLLTIEKAEVVGVVGGSLV